MFQAQNRETINSTWKVAVSYKIIIMTRVTRSSFTTQHQNCKIKTDFLVSDLSCPKTDGLRPHHWTGSSPKWLVTWWSYHAVVQQVTDHRLFSRGIQASTRPTVIKESWTWCKLMLAIRFDLCPTCLSSSKWQSLKTCIIQDSFSSTGLPTLRWKIWPLKQVSLLFHSIEVTWSTTNCTPLKRIQTINQTANVGCAAWYICEI